MSGELTVGVGATVSTGGMLVEAQRLAQAELETRDRAERLARQVDAWGVPTPRPALPDAQDAFDACARRLEDVAASCGRLAWQLRMTAAGYALADEAAALLAEHAARLVTWLAPIGLHFAPGPTLTAAGVLGFGMWARSGFDVDRMLASREFVSLVRNAVDSADDAVLAAAIATIAAAPTALGFVAPTLVKFARTGTAGAAGSNAAALQRVAAAATGGAALRETPVRVQSASTGALTSAPGGYAQLAQRIPDGAPGTPQVRVEQYDGGWLVYLAGTRDFNPVTGIEPFDAASDVAMIAGESSGLERAAAAALEEAGYRSGEPIVAVGHSAGGMGAVRLAQHPELDVVAAISFGGAVADMERPEGVQVVSVEHRDDLVPALAGNARPQDAGFIPVRREVFDGVDVPEGPVPAHQLVRYRETAELMDASPEPSLARVLAVVDGITGEGRGAASTWTAERIPDAAGLSPARGGR
ncbi:hypothetical protein [Agromyces seonyuensis]|uniref:Alpha/beta hydrolase n=1 Tax=Agromyces seonyuensis TaxID=2662446 RepID=A0A6I4NZA8_9MICO|nr:hypothetical protein [Agromyces seonyuensis]MWB99660.1 hypothetical protein [Agromyces seonyuensis]